jgi:hypothetical protein
MQRFAMLAAAVLFVALGVGEALAVTSSRGSCPNGQCSTVSVSTTTETSSASSGSQCSNGTCNKSSRPTRRFFTGRWFARFRS